MNATQAVVAGDARARAVSVRIMLFDVDGILTDGTLWYSEAGESVKPFNVLDGQGIKLLQQAGIETGLLTSRQSGAVERRARELGITLVMQGIHDKLAAFTGVLSERGLALEQSAFMGDDLVDLRVLTRCGFAASVPDAPESVRSRVHLVTQARGGRGAAREACEFILSSQGRLDDLVAAFCR